MGIQMMVEARKTGEDPQQNIMGGAAMTTFLDDLNEFKTVVLDDPIAAFKALFNQPNRILWKWLKSYRDELELLKVWQAGIEASRTIEKSGTYQPAIKNVQARLKAKDDGSDDLFFGNTSAIVLKFFSKLASAKIAQQLAMTACALERYKLEAGRYPEELNQLVPKFLESVPLDPIDGKPLRYHQSSDRRFLLYSIGENAVDDGGDPNRENTAPASRWIRPLHPLYGRDWVWPLPATEDQILEWERHESGAAK
jgi:hypothetical protein